MRMFFLQIMQTLKVTGFNFIDENHGQSLSFKYLLIS